MNAFSLQTLTHLVDPAGGELTLKFAADVPKMLNASNADEEKLASQIAAEIAEALDIETPAVKAANAARAELDRAQGKLAAMQERQAALPTEIKKALALGDTEQAVRLQSELSAMPPTIKSYGQRIEDLRVNSIVADTTLAAEQKDKADAIRARHAAAIQKKLDSAYAALARAVEPALKEVMRFRGLRDAAREGWQLAVRGYPLSEAEKQAIADRLLEEGNKRNEEGRRIAEEEQRRISHKLAFRPAVGLNPAPSWAVNRH